MKASQMAQLVYRLGWVINHTHYVQFCDYLREMVARQRVFIIKENDEVIALCFYFITDDYNKVYKKDTWALVNDNQLGHQIYIDKLICSKWTKEVRVAVQDAIEEKYPHIEVGIYHRAPKDRCVKILNRRNRELQNTVSR